jgi:multidrug efflux pump subunit AcrA (membrane-fusion protein)
MPLDSAAVAPGFVRVESHHRTVQNLEGGIVKDILAHEGDRVAAGQVLLRLTSAENSAALGALRDQDMMLKAELARLDAERNNAAAVTFPAELLAPGAPESAAGICRPEHESRVGCERESVAARYEDGPRLQLRRGEGSSLHAS